MTNTPTEGGSMGNRELAKDIVRRFKGYLIHGANDPSLCGFIQRALDDKDRKHEETRAVMMKLNDEHTRWMQRALGADARIAELEAEVKRKDDSLTAAYKLAAQNKDRARELEAENAKLKTAVVGTRNDALLEQLWRERGDSVTRLKSERDEAVKRAEAWMNEAERQATKRDENYAALAAEKERNRTLVDVVEAQTWLKREDREHLKNVLNEALKNHTQPGSGEEGK